MPRPRCPGPNKFQPHPPTPAPPVINIEPVTLYDSRLDPISDASLLPPHHIVNIEPVTLYDSHQARPHLRRIYKPYRTAVYILNLSLYWGPRYGGSVCGSWRAELQADEVVQRILD